MVNRTTYYSLQAVKNLKRSILIICGLALAMSMVAGLNYYTDSSQKAMLDSQLRNIVDFSFTYDGSPLTYNQTHFTDLNEDVNTVLQNRNFPSKERFNYLLYDITGAQLYQNNSLPNGSYSGVLSDYYQQLRIIGTDENFFGSDRFDQYYTLISGDIPQHPGEILIDYAFAYRFGLSVGEYTNLTLERGNYYYYDFYYSSLSNTESNELPLASQSSEYYLNSTQFEGFKIVGTYLVNPDYYYFKFGSTYTYVTYDYGDYRDGGVPDDYSWINNQFTFAYYNFSAPVQNTLLNSLFYTVENNLSVSFDQKNGMVVNYDLDSIDFSRLSSVIKSLTADSEKMEDLLPSSISLESYLPDTLEQVYASLASFKFAINLMNIPILIFAIILGTFANKLNMESRNEEMLLMRSKGTPNALLKNQLLIEGVVLGLVSGAISLGLGYGPYYLFGNWLKDLFGSTVDYSDLIITESTIITVLILSVFVSVLSSFGSVKYVNRLKTSELLISLDQNSYDLDYDEQSLFAKNKKPHDKKSHGSHHLSENTTFESMRNESEEDLYTNVIEEKESKGKGKAIILIIIGSFPLIIVVLQYLSQLPSSPDSLQAVSAQLSLMMTNLFILAFASPVLISIGLIHMIVVDSPSRYARLSRSIGNVFLKSKGYLVGLEMIKRKKLTKLIYLLGIFLSLLVFTNISINNLTRYSNISANLEIGSDMKIRYTSYQARDSMANVSNYLESIKGIQDESNNSIIKDATPFYGSNNYYSSEASNLFVNFSAYEKICLQDENRNSFQNIQSLIDEVQTYNEGKASSDPVGVLVSPNYLTNNNYEIGDEVDISMIVDMDEEGVYIEKEIPLIFIDTIETIPGFQVVSTWDYYSEFIFLDLEAVGQYFILTPTPSFGFFVDVKSEYQYSLNETYLTEQIQSMELPNFGSPDVYYFYQDWNSATTAFQMNSMGYIGVIYMEFIVIGILIAFGMAILLISFQRENQSYNGILLARGFGKIDILKFMMAQISIIYAIAIVVGIISGAIISSSLVISTGALTFISGINLPVYINYGEIFGIIGLIVGLSVIIYLISYIFEYRKPVTHYFYKF